jgi:hypothetical protein
VPAADAVDVGVRKWYVRNPPARSACHGTASASTCCVGRVAARLQAEVRLRGCVAVWLSGYLAVWLSGCLAARLHAPVRAGPGHGAARARHAYAWTLKSF